MTKVIQDALFETLGNQVQLEVRDMRWSPVGKLTAYDRETGRVELDMNGLSTMVSRLILDDGSVIAVGIRGGDSPNQLAVRIQEL